MRENDYIRRGYTVILARIILNRESRGVGILDHIKARANDVESLLITPRKPTVPRLLCSLSWRIVGSKCVRASTRFTRYETSFPALLSRFNSY